MSDSDADGIDLSTNFYGKYSKKLIPTRALIKLVKEKNMLWDRNDPRYRDKLAKEQAWQDIFRQFEPTFDALNPTKKHLLGNMIVKKWNNVRDAYVKSRKLSNRYRPYVHSDDLQFLDTVLPPESLINKGSIKRFRESIVESLSNGDPDNDMTDSWVNQVFVNIEDEENESSEPNLKRVKLECNPPSKEVAECDESIVSVLVNLIQREEDEDRAFFKSITPAVKKLSESSKFEFRIQVMKLIKSLKMKEKHSVKHRKEKESSVLSESE